MGLQRPLLCSRRRREALLVLRTLDVLQRLRHQGVLAKHLLDLVFRCVADDDCGESMMTIDGDDDDDQMSRLPESI